MTRRMLLSLCAIGVLSGFVVTPVVSAQQSVNFYLGAFNPTGKTTDLTDRGVDDVFFQNADFLGFDFDDFNGVTLGGEYLVGLGDFFDAGLGIGYYQQSTLATDLDFTFPNGSPIDADLKLKIVPVWATVRYLPLGHHDAITPYVGGGVVIYNWRYSESGDFVNVNGDIVNGTFTGKDTTVGPAVLGGVRVPIGKLGIGGEIRWQGGKGDLPADQTFAGSKINLGGFNYLFTVGVNF
jgi:hypothetical protein